VAVYTEIMVNSVVVSLMRIFAVCIALVVASLMAPLAFAQDRAQPQRAEVQRQAQPGETMQRKLMLRATVAQPSATPVERRVYEDAATALSSGEDGPNYTCEHNAQGEPISCWCNWSTNASDCKDMILAAPCGDGNWWTSDVPGEYGCDT
jgi:hypothetical protein